MSARGDDPAFPTHGGDSHEDPRNRILSGGMTLRDYFAGQFLMGAAYHWMSDQVTSVELASFAYNVADAMIAERERRHLEAIRARAKAEREAEEGGDE